MLIGGIEAGGTKMVCAVGDENGFIIDRVSFPTRQPRETFADMIAYYKKWDIEALGIGCFGPIDLNKRSETYGYITKTPKPGWENCNIVGAFSEALNVPVGFDTDVNGAVLGEVTWGAARGLESAVYITIGTGVGVGVYVNGGLLHGLVHPEGGHVLLARHPGDNYEGKCPFHKSCVEGLASGPAIEARWGKRAVELADRDEVWELEAYYIAQAVANYILSYSPQKIILWGGVMHQERLFGMVRKEVQRLLNGYVPHGMITDTIEDYIVPPALGENPGIMGAVKLGLDALSGTRRPTVPSVTQAQAAGGSVGNTLGLSWPGGNSWVSGTVPEWAQNAAGEEKKATMRAINREYQRQAAAGYDLGEAEGGITSYSDMVIVQFRNGDNVTSPWDANRKWGAIIAPFAGMAFSVKDRMAGLWEYRLPIGDSLEWTNPDTGKTDTWQMFYGSESFIGDSSESGTGWGFVPGSTLKNGDLIEAMIRAYARSAYYNEDMKRPYTLGLLMDNARVDEATGIVYQEFFGNDSAGVAPNRQDTRENKWGVSYMAAGSEDDAEVFIITDKIMTAWGRTWKSNTDRFSVSGAPVADQVTDEEGNVSQIFEKIVITVAKDGTETVISRDNAMRNFSVGVEGSQVYANGDTLDVVFPAGTDTAEVAPTFDIQENAKAVPASGTALGAKPLITYTITAESGETREYTVTVYVAAATPADEDRAAAGTVMNQIDELPGAEDIYLNHRETVAAARRAYEARTPVQKSLVTNLDKLNGAEQAVKRLENTPVRVTCVGDSITEGVGATISAKCYVSQVQKLLGSEFTICNAGVSGTTLMSTPEAYISTGRYTEGQSFAPDVVTIMLGTNDSKDRFWGQGGNGKYDAEQFEREMTQLVKVYLDLPSRPIVMVATSPTVYGKQIDTIDDSCVTEIIEVQKKVAADLGCPVIDINTYTKGHEDWFVDGVHPNDKGHTEMAKEFARALAEVNKAVLSSVQVGDDTIELRKGVYDYTIDAAGDDGTPAVTAVGANGAQVTVDEGDPITITVISKNNNYKSVYTITAGSCTD